MKKISIIGPESTGKSELAQQLAKEFQAEWVPEFARFYLDRLDRDYKQHDLLEIAKGQVAWEDDKANYTNNYLFCDTDLLVIKVWSEHKYQSVDEWILKEIESRKYDFHLLSDIDIPWRPDPQREHPNLREYFFEVYENLLKEMQLPYGVVKGIEGDRLACAVQHLRENKIID